ncbi:diacylglycerol kinase family protein [Arthrobacter sp. RCC_34]|uniref:diacylglycerol/lipid kinase family protein n=1 Tax=Arthrobacter sp. RCC_34 TaxID=3239230 RepID=UPI0035239519
MQRIGLVWNPSKVSREDLEAALAEFPDAKVSWWETDPEDPGQGAARRALEDGADVVIAAGGDGTVRAVAETLAGSDAEVPLGIVPLGTGNLLARNLGVPLGSLKDALGRAIAGEEPRKIDLAWVEAEIDGVAEKHASAVMAGIGIDAHMITETDDDLKSRAGWLAYVEAIGRAIGTSDVLDLTLTLDDEEPWETSAHTLLVGNCGTIQGGMVVFPDAEPDDGLLDLALLSADGIGTWLDTARSYLWDNGIRKFIGKEESTVDSDSVSHRQARRLTVELSEPRILEIDGEDLGEVSSFTVSVQEGALTVR